MPTPSHPPVSLPQLLLGVPLHMVRLWAFLGIMFQVGWGGVGGIRKAAKWLTEESAGWGGVVVGRAPLVGGWVAGRSRFNGRR